MAKQRRVTSSKKGPKKVKKASLTLEQMLIEADAAFEALDNSRANSLYEAAAKALHEKLEADPAVSVILSKVLGKLGETKVSMGDQEGARDDFERAIALLNEQHGEGGDGEFSSCFYFFPTIPNFLPAFFSVTMLFRRLRQLPSLSQSSLHLIFTNVSCTKLKFACQNLYLVL